MKQEGSFFCARHSLKPIEGDPESVEFLGLSETGMELAMERGRDPLNLLDTAAAGTVMFLGGCSEAERTRSTVLAFGTGIRLALQKDRRNDVSVMLPGDMPNFAGSYTTRVSSLLNLVDPNRKMVVVLPLLVKLFSECGVFRHQNGTLTAYSEAWIRRNGGDVKDWFANWNSNPELLGPDPRWVAERQLTGISRLHRFMSDIITSRPTLVGAVGHSVSLDALAVYLANDGEVTVDGFERLGDRMIGETEMFSVMSQGSQQIFRYRDQEVELR